MYIHIMHKLQKGVYIGISCTLTSYPTIGYPGSCEFMHEILLKGNMEVVWFGIHGMRGIHAFQASHWTLKIVAYPS